MPIARQAQPRLELKLRFGGRREVSALQQAGGFDGCFDQLGHLLAGKRLRVEHQVELVGGGLGFAETGFALGALGGFQLEKLLARGWALHAVIEHQVADAHALRRHDVDPQHAGKIPRVQLSARGAIDDVVFRGEARQHGGDQRRPGLFGNRRFRAEFLPRQSLHARLRQQLESQPLRSDARNLFIPATRMPRNGDQRHVTCS